MTERSVTSASVPEVLQAYADRGLLRNLSSARKDAFDFMWLNHKPMQLQWKSAKQTVVFVGVLPNISARSALYRDLRAFLKGRTEADLPAHRRVDPAKFELICQNRASCVSIGLRVLASTEELATRKLMLVMHEVFLMLNDRWLDYMYEEFDVSTE